MTPIAPRSARIRAPAKVNLSLKVLSKREDGYHELDSLMFAVSLYDTLTVSVSPSALAAVSCTVTGPEAVEGGETNLASRAASGVLEALGVTARVGVALDKHIPFGAGLGGGSSDAAAVIRLLPRLLGSRLAPGRARALARSLGADVPFFLGCRPSRATGIGDQLEPLSAVPSGTLLVAVPPERVNTAWAYRSALPRLTSSNCDSSFRALPSQIEAVESWFSNDFQRGVEQAVGSVRQVREVLQGLGARATVLSGSGSAVVGYFANPDEARAAARRYEGPGRVYRARILRGAPRPSMLA